MKLPDKINPMHCASTDATRYILNGVALVGNLAIATNGRALFACVGTRESNDDSRPAILPKRAAKAAFPQTKRKALCFPLVQVLPREEGQYGATRITVTQGEETTYREIDGNFPNIEKVIPPHEGYSLTVGLNIKLLLDIAKCYGDDQLLIHLDPNEFKHGRYTAGMLITSPKTRDALAVLMPLRGDDEPLPANGVLKDLAKRQVEASEAEKAAAAEAARVAAEKAAEELAKADAWMAANEPKPRDT